MVRKYSGIWKASWGWGGEGQRKGGMKFEVAGKYLEKRISKRTT